ncbi:hypothetical protein MKW92_043987 [Papaver armeniacum]|nr:hypothetical protein MKW92_043987 [Papaver armeniacum]
MTLANILMTMKEKPKIADSPSSAPEQKISDANLTFPEPKNFHNQRMLMQELWIQNKAVLTQILLLHNQSMLLMQNQNIEYKRTGCCCEKEFTKSYQKDSNTSFTAKKLPKLECVNSLYTELCVDTLYTELCVYIFCT